MRTKAEPLNEANVSYTFSHDCKYRFREVYLYRWFSPIGWSGLSAVYVDTYADFRKLLKHWSRDGWTYVEDLEV